MAPNIPAMYELHFGVPMAGAVLCSLNIRHDSAMVSTLLKHSEAKMIFVDYQLLETARGALEILSKTRTMLPRLAGADVCGGYGGLQPGVFFFKFFFTPVIKLSPPLSPTTLNTQPPAAQPLSIYVRPCCSPNPQSPT